MSQRPKKAGPRNAPFKQLKRDLYAALERQTLAASKAAATAHQAAQRAIRDKAQVEKTEDDLALFARAVADVAPLGPVVERVRVPDPERPPLPTDDELALAELQQIVSGGGTFAVHESEEALFGSAPGVNDLLVDQLRRGEFAYQQHLDLHGLTRDEAHLQVAQFVVASRRQAERCVLIVTGRGRSSIGGVSVLRQALPRWLSRAPCRPHVLAFCTARAHDGGAGAFYVLLRRPGVKPFGAAL